MNRSADKIGKKVRNHLWRKAPRTVQARMQVKTDKARAARLFVTAQNAFSFSASALNAAVKSKAIGDLVKFMKTVADKESTKLALIKY